jgi:hypothetical protein
MRTHNKSLRVSHLDYYSHKRTCGYWYTVTAGSFSHTAFATRAGLDRYLAERGLSLATPLHTGDTVDDISHAEIIGTYREESHLHDAATFQQIQGERTRTLSNGDWVEAIITTDPDGIRTVHTLNPNVRDRLVFDYRESCKMML